MHTTFDFYHSPHYPYLFLLWFRTFCVWYILICCALQCSQVSQLWHFQNYDDCWLKCFNFVLLAWDKLHIDLKDRWNSPQNCTSIWSQVCLSCHLDSHCYITNWERSGNSRYRDVTNCVNVTSQTGNGVCTSIMWRNEFRAHRRVEVPC